MRSRYSAFAIGAVDYLIATLDPEHDDRAVPEATLRAALLASSRAHRYTGLTIQATEDLGDEAFVTFEAKVFERGVDRSFAERSRFRRRPEGWRYLSGEQALSGRPKAAKEPSVS